MGIFSPAAQKTGFITHEELIKRRAERKRAEKSRPTQAKSLFKKSQHKEDWIKTKIAGFDDLLEKGIPAGSAVLVAGGPGTGKTIFCLQLIANATANGKKCAYLSFEESEQRLRQHMNDFGWSPEKAEKQGLLLIKRLDPFKISRSVEALLAKERGELLIKIKDSIVPFKGLEIIVIDSISALEAGFFNREEAYRIYIEQLFRYLEKLKTTSFLISETEDAPKKLSNSGVEEFLADGAIVLYNIRREGNRERAIEVLKMRGAKHKEKIAAFQITEGEGIVVYPEQQLFEEM